MIFCERSVLVLHLNSNSVGRLKKIINSAQNFQARSSHLVEKNLIQPYPVCSHCLLRSLCPPLAHRESRFVTNFWQWTPFCKDGSPNTVGNFSNKSNFSLRTHRGLQLNLNLCLFLQTVNSMSESEYVKIGSMCIFSWFQWFVYQKMQLYTLLR